MRAAKAAGMTVDAEGNLIVTRHQGVAVIKEVVQANYLLTEAEREASKAAEAVGKSEEKTLSYNEAFAKSMQGTSYTISDMSVATYNLVNAMTDVPNLMDDIAGRGEKVMSAYADLADAQQKLSDAAANYGQNTGNEVANLLEQRLGPASERYKNVLDEIDAVMGTGLVAEKEHADAVAAIVAAYAQTGDQEAFKENLQSLADQELPAVTAELQQAVLDAKNLTQELLGLPEYLHVEVNIEATGDLDVLDFGRGTGTSTPGTGTHAGGGGPQEGFASGTNGWLTVPPGYPNDNYTVGLTSGEVYNVARAGQKAQTQAPHISIFGPVTFQSVSDLASQVGNWGL